MIFTLVRHLNNNKTSFRYLEWLNLAELRFQTYIYKFSTNITLSVDIWWITSWLRQHLNVRGVDYRFITETSGLLCNNAVVTGAATLATSQIVGNFMGVTENMTHTKIFTEINLEFYVDKEYKVLKFLNIG